MVPLIVLAAAFLPATVIIIPGTNSADECFNELLVRAVEFEVRPETLNSVFI
jgi:hypothetical protein